VRAHKKSRVSNAGGTFRDGFDSQRFPLLDRSSANARLSSRPGWIYIYIYIYIWIQRRSSNRLCLSELVAVVYPQDDEDDIMMPISFLSQVACLNHLSDLRRNSKRAVWDAMTTRPPLLTIKLMHPVSTTSDAYVFWNLSFKVANNKERGLVIDDDGSTLPFHRWCHYNYPTACWKQQLSELVVAMLSRFVLWRSIIESHFKLFCFLYNLRYPIDDLRVER
jgi:hypothetical protein